MKYAFVALMTATFSLSAAEVTHRWSFNGDYADAVGGADAVKCGTYVSLYGGKVHMGYGECSHGTGYVNLGKNILDTTSATIELWARHDGVKSWSRVLVLVGTGPSKVNQEILPLVVWILEK